MSNKTDSICFLPFPKPGSNVLPLLVRRIMCRKQKVPETSQKTNFFKSHQIKSKLSVWCSSAVKHYRFTQAWQIIVKWPAGHCLSFQAFKWHLQDWLRQTKVDDVLQTVWKILNNLCQKNTVLQSTDLLCTMHNVHITAITHRVKVISKEKNNV